MTIMKQTKLFTLLAALICATTTAWAQTTFLGSGNSTDPYLLKSSNEWEALAKQVAEGKNFQNQFFRRHQGNTGRLIGEAFLRCLRRRQPHADL